MTKLTGRCACGAVTWETDGPVLWSGHCRCESCRRASSSPVTSFFGVSRASVTWRGDIVIRKSSKNVERGHCGACGSQVLFRADLWPDETHLYAATLDDPAQFTPEAHFHWAERVPWLTIADDLPKYAASADDAEPIPGA